MDENASDGGANGGGAPSVLGVPTHYCYYKFDLLKNIFLIYTLIFNK
jgi:hypothetical protein